MATATLLVPALFPEDVRSQFPSDLNPEQAKRRLDAFLADGYRIKVMNDFVYGNVVFTHYALEKE